MKKIVAITIVFLLILPQLSLSKQDDLRFTNVYNRAFYTNPWIQYAILATVIITLSTWTVYTGGTGAPAASAGVSTVASWVAGGGAGSYMAGLSIIGKTFGGNAILGAAILNSASALSIGGVVGQTGIAKVSQLIISSLQAGQIAVIVLGDDIKEISAYSIVIPLNTKIGSKDAKYLISEFKSVNKKIDKGKMKYEDYLIFKEDLKDKVITLFKSSVYDEDKVVATMLLHNLGFIDEFIYYADKLPLKLDIKYNFIIYLKSIAKLLKGDFNAAFNLSKCSMDYEPKVLEPILINVLSRQAASSHPNDFTSYVDMYIENIDNYKKSYYVTPNNKLSSFLLLGNLCMVDEDYNKAIQCFNLALSETKRKQKDVKANICALIGNSNYRLGKKTEAITYYNKAIEYSDGNDDIQSTFYFNQ